MEEIKNRTMLSEANENIVLTQEEKEKMLEEAAFYYGLFMRSLRFDYEKDPHSCDTPKRVAKSFINDLIKGCYSAEPSITAFANNKKYDGIIFQGNIPMKSICSHHHLAFSGKAHVAYIPAADGKVIGLSKLNRIVDFYARRPQVQESLTMQIHDSINKFCEGNRGVAVVIEAGHTCCSNRGIGHDSVMKTSKLSGLFFDNPIGTREEFYRMIADLK